MMSSATLVSASEYLATSWRPDRELIDGQLLVRLGDCDHANLQARLVIWLGVRERELNIKVLPEQRVRVAFGRYRVPDVCVIWRDQEKEPVFTRPPLVCIEILSKDDSLRSLQDRVDDYLNFGVPNIWILDPVKRLAYVCSRGKFQEPDNRTLEVPDSPIRIPLDELFADLD